jgi:hypothetical protein
MCLVLAPLRSLPSPPRDRVRDSHYTRGRLRQTSTSDAERSKLLGLIRQRQHASSSYARPYWSRFFAAPGSGTLRALCCGGAFNSLRSASSNGIGTGGGSSFFGVDMRQMRSILVCGEKLLAAIGSVAVESAYLERDIEALLYALTKLDRETGFPIIEKGMIDGKIGLLRAIAEPKLKKRRKWQRKFLDIISRLKITNSDRTTVIHGVWMPALVIVTLADDFSTESITTGKKGVSRRGKPGKSGAEMDETRAVQVASAISDARFDLREFAHSAWRIALAPNPAVPPQPAGRKRSHARKGASKPSSPLSA